jgi:hypothetical protein
MTEQVWLTADSAYPLLIIARERATVRKLRLIAAAYVRWLKTLPGYEDARPFADLIERYADEPFPSSEEEFNQLVYSVPGVTWSLGRTFVPDDRVGQELTQTVFMAECRCGERGASPHSAHERIITLLHEIIGNPFRPVAVQPAWLTSTVVELARGIYAERAFDRLPILADALQDAGCEDEDILAHCRDGDPHARGCWVVDLVLGKS